MREELLSIIEKNSRIGLNELAVMLGTSEDEVLKELETLEKENIICGYHTLIDWEKTSIEKVTALIEVRGLIKLHKEYTTILKLKQYILYQAGLIYL